MIERAETTTEDESQRLPTYDEAIEYVASSRSYKEWQQRREELAKKVWELNSRYGPKIWEGENSKPNPNYDKARFEQATDLLLASSMVSWKSVREELVRQGKLQPPKRKKE